MFNRKLFLATMIALLAVLLIAWVVSATPGAERSGDQAGTPKPATSAGAITEELSSPASQPPTAPDQDQSTPKLGGRSISLPD